jgi:hypothetical protein
LTCIGISNENKDQSVIIGAGAGVGSAIAILLIIGVIVFLLKRRRDCSPGTIYHKSFTNMYICIIPYEVCFISS